MSLNNMDSITRRLLASYTRRSLQRILVSSLLLFCMAFFIYLLAVEHSALGYISANTSRTFEIIRNSSAHIEEIAYRLTSEGKETAELLILDEIRLISISCGVIFLLRISIFFIVFVPLQNTKFKRMLSPLNELALKADELSKMEFGEDKFHMIEDAISQIDAEESSTISLGDRDLLGVEAAINNLLVRIRESNRQQARFVSDASHELRTPIAVISGYADMLSRWGKEDENVLEEGIAAIGKESVRMKHLVEQLLFLARGDSGKTTLQLEDTDLCELMREAYEESVMIDEQHVYKYLAPEAKEIDGVSLVVQADSALIKQAVRALIDNAAKYTKERDEIILSVGASDGHPYLQVQDSGIGMEEDEVTHMFDRFYRADEARSYEGTGLGLSIAKWIVDKHRGHFEILSRDELGTRIRIVL